MLSAFITGLAGLDLTAREAAVLRQARPAGVILFARNVADPDQVRRLTQDAKAAIGADDILVLIDQEGGRVRRLRPPHWRELPAAAAYGAMYAQDRERALRAARLVARLTAADLRGLGINTDCTPVLDLPVAGSHEVIGDRAYGHDPAQVAALGRAVAEGFMAGGVLPVIKHVPGHGRATADSHKHLPVVDASREELEATDFAPFRALGDLPVAGSHEVIGDRAYGHDPAQVAALGRAVAEGFMAGGVLPVIKHVPGHGRATADSHKHLPVVDASREELEATDFAPFRALGDLPAAMTAHVVFTAIDAGAAASISRRVTGEVIRGTIGFDGLLMSDDLGMQALSGTVAERAAAVIAAGSDLALLCSGNLSETESVAAAVPKLDGAALARYRRACAVFGQQQPFDVAEAEICLAEVLRAVA